VPPPPLSASVRRQELRAAHRLRRDTVDTTCSDVERHYGRGQILQSIMRALRDMQKDISTLSPVDLALVDEFHTRGRAATIAVPR
jgi:hypothetical protein